MGRPRKQPELPVRPVIEPALPVAVYEQPPLFREWPEQPELVEHLKRWVVTGSTVSKDEERCAEIVGAVLSGASKRRIASYFHVGRETIDAIMRHLEETGKLRPLKERITAGWSAILVSTQESLLEAVENRTLPGNVQAILAGIATDKWLALTGSGTGEEPAKRPVITIDQVNAAYDSIKRALAVSPVIDVPSTDSGSDASGPKDQQSEVSPGLDTGMDTTSAGSERPTAPGPTASDGGGGGSEFPAGPGQVDPLPSDSATP